MTTENEEFLSAEEVLRPIREKLTLGKLIRSLRLCDEVSQEDLAQRLGVSKQFVNAIERGRKRASIELAARIAEALGYPPSALVATLLRDQLREAGMAYDVELKPHSAA